MPGKDGPNFNQDNNGRYDINQNGNHNGGTNNPQSDRYEADENFEPEEGHEHKYSRIIQTRNLSAYAEAVHEVVTLEFHDRGLSLDLSFEEAQELGKVLEAITSYLRRQQTS